MFRTLTCPFSGGQIVLSQHVNTIAILCKRLHSMPDESRMLSSGILYIHLQRVTIQDAVIKQFVLLKMGTLMLETCQGL